MSASNTARVQPEKMHLLSTHISKCNIDCPIDISLKHVEGHTYDLDFGLAFNLDDALVKATFSLNLRTKSNTEEQASGIFEFVYIYRIDNLNELAMPNDKGVIELDSSLGTSLAAISYSTARGILFSLIKGTVLESFILPIINPSELFK